MKVMCIDDSPRKKDGKPNDVVFGETYTVTDERTCPDGILHYRLAERGFFDYYGAFRFARISSIDETELVNEREPQTT